MPDMSGLKVLGRRRGQNSIPVHQIGTIIRDDDFKIFIRLIG
jgi:hypothetical protein